MVQLTSSADVPFRPGRICYAVVVGFTALAFWGCSSLTLDMGWRNWTLVFLFSLILLPLWIGYLILFLTDVVREEALTRRFWLRWLGAPAFVVIAATALLFDVPTSVRYWATRPALEAAADRVEAGAVYGPGWLGLYRIDRAEMTSAGPVFFIDDLRDYAEGGCGLARLVRDPEEDRLVIVETVDDRWAIVCLDGSG